MLCPTSGVRLLGRWGQWPRLEQLALCTPPCPTPRLLVPVPRPPSRTLLALTCTCHTCTNQSPRKEAATAQERLGPRAGTFVFIFYVFTLLRGGLGGRRDLQFQVRDDRRKEVRGNSQISPRFGRWPCVEARPAGAARETSPVRSGSSADPRAADGHGNREPHGPGKPGGRRRRGNHTELGGQARRRPGTQGSRRKPGQEAEPGGKLA